MAFTRIVPLRFCPVHMVIVSAKDMKLSFYNNYGFLVISTNEHLCKLLN